MKRLIERPGVKPALILCVGLAIVMVISIRLFLSWWHPCVGKFLIVTKLEHTAPEDVARRIAEEVPTKDRQRIMEVYMNSHMKYDCYVSDLRSHDPPRIVCPFKENSSYEVIGERNPLESLLHGAGYVLVRVPGVSDPLWVEKFIGMEFRDRKGNRYFCQKRVWYWDTESGVESDKVLIWVWFWPERL
ncbi:MAG: hypothetical protein HYU64_09980 [Armatimonadetes bacterium]|nr:hypothetical protein [Armatimonadota bacterium]